MCPVPHHILKFFTSESEISTPSRISSGEWFKIKPTLCLMHENYRSYAARDGHGSPDPKMPINFVQNQKVSRLLSHKSLFLTHTKVQSSTRCR
jgi:hypothetical protein